MSAAAKWTDLAPRLISAVVMVAVGGVLIYLGGWPFRLLVWAAGGVMMWELARMFGARFPVGPGALAAVVLAVAHLLPALMGTGYAVPVLILAAALAGAGQVKRDRMAFVLYGLVVLAGCHALVTFRDLAGLEWVLWLVGVVVATDVAGYFAGRVLGGPKFWPRVSPKKTWSGTVAGWICAGLVGAGFAAATDGAGAALVAVSVALALAAQLGDIAESAVKRRRGVKDSSNLIPGHGGFLDRFDGLLAAAAAGLVFWGFNVMSQGA